MTYRLKLDISSSDLADFKSHISAINKAVQNETWWVAILNDAYGAGGGGGGPRVKYSCQLEFPKEPPLTQSELRDLRGLLRLKEKAPGD